MDFAAGDVIADYSVARARRRLDGVHRARRHCRPAPTASAIDAVEPGGIFGYTPLLTGGGMEFVARATEPSTLIRLPGDAGAGAVRQTGGAGLPGVVGVEHVAGNRPALVPVADTRPVGELVHGDVLLVAPDDSVRDAVIQMTEHHVSYALIRAAGRRTSASSPTATYGRGWWRPACRWTCRSRR